MKHKYLNDDDILYDDDNINIVYIDYKSEFSRSKILFYSIFKNPASFNKEYFFSSLLIITEKKKRIDDHMFDGGPQIMTNICFSEKYYDRDTLKFLENYSDLLFSVENLERCGTLRRYVETIRKGLFTANDSYGYFDIRRTVRSCPSLMRKIISEDEHKKLIVEYSLENLIYHDPKIIPNGGFKNFDYDITTQYPLKSGRTLNRIQKTNGFVIICLTSDFITTRWDDFKFNTHNQPDWIKIITDDLIVSKLVQQDLVRFGYPFHKIEIIFKSDL